jgi:hypothetical protein
MTGDRDRELDDVVRRRDELRDKLLALHRRWPNHFPLPPEMLQQGDWTFMWASDVPDDVSSLTDGEDR